MPMVVIADERTQNFDTPGFRMASLSETAIGGLGLAPHPDAGWMCGDYALYLAAEVCPEASHFWLIDSDVRINFEAPADFFATYDSLEADYVAIRHQLASSSWFWRARMAALASPVYQGLFGVLRISRRAVLHLHRMRKRLRSLPDAACPNDEAFVATVLANSGFSCRRFSDRADLFPARTYGFRRIESGRALEGQPADNLVHHAVLFGEDYVAKALRLCALGEQSASLDEMTAAATLEVGNQRAEKFTRFAAPLIAATRRTATRTGSSIDAVEAGAR